MSLKVVKDELLKTLNAQLALFAAGPYKIGLFKNNYTPVDTSVIGDITPANFSGYTGLQNLTAWPSASWVTPRASSTHPNVVWTHNGGPTINDIYGYYVVDAAGALAWADRASTAPATIGVSGQTYTVSPQFTRRSEF